MKKFPAASSADPCASAPPRLADLIIRLADNSMKMRLKVGRYGTYGHFDREPNNTGFYIPVAVNLDIRRLCWRRKNQDLPKRLSTEARLRAVILLLEILLLRSLGKFGDIL